MTEKNPSKALIEMLSLAYDIFNAELFGGSLSQCMFTLNAKGRVIGFFSPDRYRSKVGDGAHELAVNPRYFVTRSLLETLQTLAHEMVHLWQHEYGKPSRSGYHNKEWGNKMESIGLMPSNTGEPGGKKRGQQMMDYPIIGRPFLAVAQKIYEKGFRIPWAHVEETECNTRILPGLEYLPPGLISKPKFEKSASRANQRVHVADGDVENRTGRERYTCECQDNIWGRPGLEITCKTCEKDFVVTSAKVPLKGPPGNKRNRKKKWRKPEGEGS